MFRGTTPTLEFVLPFNTDLLEDILMTVAQKNVPLINKTMTDAECSENTVIIKLEQADTLKLNDKYDAHVQLRVKTKNGDAFASDIFRVAVSQILKDGVI